MRYECEKGHPLTLPKLKDESQEGGTSSPQKTEIAAYCQECQVHYWVKVDAERVPNGVMVRSPS